MFRIGEKVVYMGKCEVYNSLKIFNIYTINNVNLETTFYNSCEYIFGFSEKSMGELYYSEFFIKLSEYRKLKLQKIELCLK